MSARRSSHWVRTFDHARRVRDWVVVQRLYKQATAAQLTSDICNAHKRDPSSLRMKGIHPGEVWEAYWRISPDGPNGDHEVWIRLVSETNRTRTRS